VQIVSGEPWVPWEMCKLVNPEPPYEPGRYLCEAFAVARWLPDHPPQPALSLDNLALVAPGDSGLPHAQEERDYLLELHGRQVTQIPASVPHVIRALRSGQYDGWHFTGHGHHLEGQDPNFATIELENHKRLTPEYLSSARNLGQARPLVFLNACDVGRRDLSLTDVGGWADKFLWAGAAAFIAAHWSIDDGIALAFARALYTRLLDEGAPIGEAVRQSRLAVHAADPADPTWLAYTLFADPLARVRPPV
jgi:CHAT domain-containing protein